MSRFSGALLAVSVLAASFPAHAATAKPSPVIDDRFCQALVKHVPDADVAYQAGVDVHGKPVVPADLDGGHNGVLPQEFSIPLTADLMSFLNLDSSALPASAMKRNDIALGTLTIRGDQVLYNGKPLTNTQQDNLSVLCLKPTKSTR